ncbi:4Fe-4S binding protein [Candidatus Bathyarchaeota archaeon]|nr:4Fe-4S binding protein [Candidatus Bathyarchaeota archaeon]
MIVRKIVSVDEERCDGCGLCIPSCAEGALKIVNGKARLVSERFCDGLGACLGRCPNDAIRIVERVADEFSKEDSKKGWRAPAEAPEYRGGEAPGLGGEESSRDEAGLGVSKSELKHWPIKVRLVPPTAPHYQDSELLIAADCAAFTTGEFHREFLKGRVLIIGCPKFDDMSYYREKLKEILRLNEVKSVVIVNMEVPCCFGLHHVTMEAIQRSGKALPLKQTVLTVKGERLQREF